MTAALSTMMINSLININERPIGSTFTSTEGVYYMGKMNSMLESWSLERLMVPAIVEEGFSLSANTATYTIGSGGTFNTQRPAKILRAFIRDSANSDTNVAVVPFDVFASIINKNVTGSYPQYLYYDQAFDSNGLATIKVYPQPKAGLTLYLESQKQLQTFTNISTALQLPPGYQRAIESNFSIECAPGFASISPELAKIAKESKANIKGINLPDSFMRLDTGIVPGQRSGNILTGP